MSRENRTRSELLADQLHSAAIHLLRKLRKADDCSGLNAPRLSALSVIVFAGPITLGALARAEQVRPPTMTRIVNALEQQGLVRKEKRQSDRRNVYLCSTTKGKRLMMTGRNRRTQELANEIESLSEQEQAALQSAAAVMRKLAGPGSLLIER